MNMSMIGSLLYCDVDWVGNADDVGTKSD